jgi:DnaJ-class molecular chaperone
LNQTNHFFDLGYGWLCKHCSAEDAERKQHPETPTTSQSSGLALAGWTDSSRQALTCPRCGVEETIQNN